MKTTKHTQGEWHYVSTANGDYVMTNLDIMKGQYIASLRADDGSTFEGLTSDETEANAKLIASAPDLLVALQLIVCGCKDENGFTSLAEIQAIAENAIKKAIE